MSDVTAEMMARLLMRAETSEAREKRALKSLDLLIKRIRRHGGHSTHDEQCALWDAEALLVETGG